MSRKNEKKQNVRRNTQINEHAETTRIQFFQVFSVFWVAQHWLVWVDWRLCKAESRGSIQGMNSKSWSKW